MVPKSKKGEKQKPQKQKTEPEKPKVEPIKYPPLEDMKEVIVANGGDPNFLVDKPQEWVQKIYNATLGKSNAKLLA